MINCMRQSSTLIFQKDHKIGSSMRKSIMCNVSSKSSSLLHASAQRKKVGLATYCSLSSSSSSSLLSNHTFSLFPTSLSNSFNLPQKSKTFTTTSSASNNALEGYDLSHSDCNIPDNIASRVGTNLHLQPNHPLNTIKTIIEDYWQQQSNGFETRDNMKPIVPTNNNFDSLLIPPDHVSRSKSDTYYFDCDTVLRTHTSAHQTTLLKQGIDRFLVTGDVYR